VISGHWGRRQNSHRVGGVAARDATRVALANLASFKFKLGWDSVRNPSEGNSGEENSKETNEHVGFDVIELEILVVSNGYTYFLYLELPHCIHHGHHSPGPWKGTGLNVR